MKKFTKPHLSGNKNGRWKGGRVIRWDGYIFIYKPNHPNSDCRGYVLEHRLMVESMIGRYLKKGEIVHHKDHNPSNNDPNNLILLNGQSDHIKEHGKELWTNRLRNSSGQFI